MKKYILIILSLGIVLRILLSFISYHSDIVPFDFAGKIISQGNITNFYDYLWDLPDNHPYLKVYPKNLFNYPPLPYFFLGGASLLTTWIVDPVIHNNFVLNFSSTLGNPQLNLLLLLMKLPYFFFDIALAFVLMGLFKTEKEKKWAFALAGFKIFPLLFIIPLVLVKTDWRERFKILCTSGITYLVFSFPFILSEGFRRTAMLAGQTTKSFYAQIPISGGESIILFLAVVIFFYVLFFYKKSSIDDLWKRFFVMILIFFIFTHYHPQWFLWTMPFFTIDLIISKFKHWPLFLGVLISFVGLLFSFDPGLTIGLFAPINPLLYNLAPIWQLLGINIDLNTYRSIFQTIFVGFAVYYIYEHK
ncbi:MAG: hypothetical protein UR35_C0001G0033 [Candidatus Woesebacteria bacterium GW2011_GWB1_33_22]|uniref:Mannosyltransferase n=1 Tax=Candidatus Woesebacteria bacterium GW2011_GWB1_33_22 TaxID=1618566 RepID=A0A0G0A2H7_9BACT|nr:MAG: hypothetical protein UR35_C0001G0033 [Candidatus Woesebacteria bacterium GW2011_GWB1_33_22]